MKQNMYRFLLNFVDVEGFFKRKSMHKSICRGFIESGVDPVFVKFWV